MRRRQSRVPSRWFIADARIGSETRIFDIVRALPRGTGIMLLCRDLQAPARRRLALRLARLARSRRLVLAGEGRGQLARVHDSRELMRAQAGGVLVLLLSPMHRTRTHPDWAPLPRLRAAALVRLARRPVLALGGMDERRFRRLKPLGFHGWAGIDAWLRT